MHCNVRQQNDCIIQVLYPAAFLLHKSWTLFCTLSQLFAVFETYFLVMCVMFVCACACILYWHSVCIQSCVCVCVFLCVHVIMCVHVFYQFLYVFVVVLFVYIHHWFVHCMFFFMLSHALSLWMCSINSLLLFKIPCYYYLSRLLCPCTVQVERIIPWFSVSMVQCNNTQKFMIHYTQVQCNTKESFYCALNTGTVQHKEYRYSATQQNHGPLNTGTVQLQRTILWFIVSMVQCNISKYFYDPCNPVEMNKVYCC